MHIVAVNGAEIGRVSDLVLRLIQWIIGRAAQIDRYDRWRILLNCAGSRMSADFTECSDQF